MENKELLRIRRFNKILTQKDTNNGIDYDIDKLNSRTKIDNRNDDALGVIIDAIRIAEELDTSRQFVMYTGIQGRIALTEAMRREVQRLSGLPAPMVMPNETFYYNIQNEQRS